MGWDPGSWKEFRTQSQRQDSPSSVEHQSILPHAKTHWLLHPGKINKTIQFRQRWTNSQRMVNPSWTMQRTPWLWAINCLNVPSPTSCLAMLGWEVKGMFSMSLGDKLNNKLGGRCPAHIPNPEPICRAPGEAATQTLRTTQRKEGLFLEP